MIKSKAFDEDRSQFDYSDHTKNIWQLRVSFDQFLFSIILRRNYQHDILIIVEAQFLTPPRQNVDIKPEGHLNFAWFTENVENCIMRHICTYIFLFNLHLCVIMVSYIFWIYWTKKAWEQDWKLSQIYTFNSIPVAKYISIIIKQLEVKSFIKIFSFQYSLRNAQYIWLIFPVTTLSSHDDTFKKVYLQIWFSYLEWLYFCVLNFSRNAKDFDPFFAKFRENCERNKITQFTLLIAP